jgi:DsbC/DsbD-like thiol-disulfide interchange protein
MEDVVTATVLPGWRDADGQHIAALRLRLEPGWKTYWRSPGDTGIPPQLVFDASTDAAAVRLHWPVPQVYWINGFRTIGYADEVILPILVTPRDPGAAVTLSGQVELGVCQDICVPVSLALSVELPAGPAAPDPRIQAALASTPGDARAQATCRIDPIDDGLRLTVTLIMPPMAGGAEQAVVEYGDLTVWVSEPATRRDGGALTMTADLVPPQAQPFALARADLRFTIFDGQGGAVEHRGCDAP